MKKFRFFSSGIAPHSRKRWLPPQCVNLPNLFELKDIPPGTFSPSIMKRLEHAKMDGTEIVLKRWRGRIEIGVKVVDKEARQKANKTRTAKIKELKSSLKHVFRHNEVKSCLRLLLKLAKVMGDRNMFPETTHQMLERL